MYKLFIFILLISTSLFSAEAQNEIYITSENDTLSLVEGIVNANNGKLVQIERDIQIQGSDPFDLIRYYDGGHHFFGEHGYGMGLSLPTLLTFNPRMRVRNLTVNQRRGSNIYFTVEKQEGKKKLYRGKVDSLFTKTGYTNCCESLLRGEASIFSMEVEGDDQQFVLKMGDGTVRTYNYFRTKGWDDHYRLVLEKLPNGNVRHYRYKEKKLIYLERVWTTNKENTLTLNWIDFSHHKKYVTINASNGQSVLYKLPTKKGSSFKSWYYIAMKWAKLNARLLTEVSGDHIPTTRYKTVKKTEEQELIFSVKEIKKPDGRFLRVGYNTDGKVKRIKTSGHTRSLYNFDYHKNYTKVSDAKGNSKKYRFDRDRRLTELSETYRTQEYKWDYKGQLTHHTLKTPNEKILNTKSYSYDSQGNITHTIVKGEMTQKGSEDEYHIRYTYSQDGRNLLLSEKINDEREVVYTYHPGTNLVSSKLTYANQKVVEREFYQYDNSAILVRKIEDDGTTRKIIEIVPQLDPNLAGLTLPKVISEFYENLNTGIKTLLKKVERTYSHGDLLAQEKVYDAHGVYRYSLSYDYNKKRQLVRESDPLGVETRYEYDLNGNKILVERIGGGVIYRYIYDESNRLIQQIEEHDDGKVLAIVYAYDVMGNRISTTDCFGQVTTFKYDSASRKIATIDPLGFLESVEYDAAGNVTKKTDKDGYITSTIYNVNGNPLEIDYPDGTQERFNYNIQGHLIKKWERDGTSHAYNVDYKGRPLVIETFGSDGSFLKMVQNSYEGSNLIHEIDAMGNIISYEYDSAGRKIARIQEDQRTEYIYDSLGHLSKAVFSEKVDVKEYDHLDRVIEKRVEDLSENIFEKTQYAYDLNGNCISEKVYADHNEYSETKTVYDSRQLPIMHTNPLGHQTTYTYHYTDHLEKETVDPLNRRINEVYDSLNRLDTLETYSSSGNLLSHSSYCYDGRRNKILQTEQCIYQFTPLSTYSISFTYDQMGQKTSEVEQDQKTTTYTYLNGKLHTITNPDLVTLTHIYDPLGTLQELFSSDSTIYFRYTYDLNDNLLTAEDLVNSTLTERSYDALNRLVYEKQATGFEVGYTYDDLNRIKSYSFIDGEITYDYSPTTLISTTRYKGNQPLYTYTQQTDWRGALTHSALPNGINISYQRDSLGRCAEIQSTHFKQSITYDPVGNITSTTVDDPQGTYTATFLYDDLDQLTQETGPFTNNYASDSLNNRRDKNGALYTLDDLNLLVNNSKNTYSYDQNGRRTQKNQTEYLYDALGRLTSYEQTSYQYDPFGRRISQGTTQYLYLFDTEVGSIENGSLKEFRAIHSQFSPFALELDNQIYHPIRNHRGDICVLLDSTAQPLSTYRYDAFGEFTQHGIQSPWLFSGQRFDPASHLYHFAKREYDPATGRFITPDPLGFADGPNLYAYVKNNPFRYFDLDGCTALEFAQGAAVTGVGIVGVGLATRGTIALTTAVCPPLGAGLALGATVYSAGSLVYDNWDSISHYANTYANKGFKAGNAEIGADLTNTFNNIAQASDYDKGCYSTSLFALIAPGRKSSRIKTQKGLKGIKGNSEKVLRQKFSADPSAQGAHSIFRRNSITGKTDKYQTFWPQSNARNPNPWEKGVRFDGFQHPHKHYNKILDVEIKTPHIHDPKCLGGVRMPKPWEMP